MLAKVYVTLKRGVHDPQGEAVRHTISAIGYKGFSNVRIGKYIELKLDNIPKEEAETALKEVCEKLLANTVIESYRFEIT